jgi:hypothetical protein
MKASETSIAPKTFVENILCSLSRPVEPGEVVPALLMKTSTRPNCSETRFTALEMEVSFSTSSWRTESVPLMLVASSSERA